MTLYDHFYGPPPWIKWLNVMGWILSLWLFYWPQPYLPLLIAVGILPPAFLVLAAIWPDSFTIENDQDYSFGRRISEQAQSLSGLWFVPCLDIGLRAMMDVRAIDILWPTLIGGALAVPMALACAKVDAKMRGWSMTVNLVICFCWCWGGLALANGLLDRTPGKIVVAEVTARRDLSDGPEVDLRLPTGDILDNTEIRRSAFARTSVGGPMCVEVNPGFFGWREAYVVDCTGPLKDLRPPALSTPSPPR